RATSPRYATRSGSSWPTATCAGPWATPRVAARWKRSTMIASSAPWRRSRAATSRPSGRFAGSLGIVSGRSIVFASWVTFGLFVVTIVPDAAGLDAFDGLASGVALALFLVSLPIWCYAFGLAVVRSARGDDVTVGN